MRVPVHVATCSERATGADVSDIVVHVSVRGSYTPPDENASPFVPPQAITRSPVHTSVWSTRGSGASAVETAVHVSSSGS